MNRRDALKILTALPAVSHVARADVAPTTVIVAECEGHLSHETRDHIRAELVKIWPNNRILVCPGDVRIRVLEER